MPIFYESLDSIYIRIQARAKRIISQFPQPLFYEVFKTESRASAAMFETDPMIGEIRRKVAGNLEQNMGHGQKHTRKVALDSGALMIIEGRRNGYPDSFLKRRMFLAQCAGILHDVKRKEADHAQRGADYARVILRHLPFQPHEIEDIACAIRNHEAFKKLLKIDTVEGKLISDCLYDADKFRWGSDNFEDTVWAMVRFYQVPLSRFMAQYSKGLEMIELVKTTFRSHTGKIYGPEFIDIGLDIGKEISRMIRRDFSCFL